jgi:hypothetical protein
MTKRASTIKSQDNIMTLDSKIVELLQETIEESYYLDGKLDVESVEWQSRDGFSAYDHNRGGFSRLSFGRIDHLVNSGTSMTSEVEKWVDKAYNQTYNEVLKNNPKLKEQTDEFYNELDSSFCGEYDCLGYKVQILYNGDNMIDIVCGYTYDAPYFRGFDVITLEKQVKFKNYSDLKKKLAKLKIDGAY